MLVAFVASAQTDCGYQPDVEPDGALGVSDVLAILGLFGSVDSDSDGIWDNNDACIDQTACNYNADATDEDGSCTYADAG